MALPSDPINATQPAQLPGANTLPATVPGYKQDAGRRARNVQRYWKRPMSRTRQDEDVRKQNHGRSLMEMTRLRVLSSEPAARTTPPGKKIRPITTDAKIKGRQAIDDPGWSRSRAHQRFRALDSPPFKSAPSIRRDIPMGGRQDNAEFCGPLSRHPVAFRCQYRAEPTP